LPFILFSDAHGIKHSSRMNNVGDSPLPAPKRGDRRRPQKQHVNVHYLKITNAVANGLRKLPRKTAPSWMLHGKILHAHSVTIYGRCGRNIKHAATVKVRREGITFMTQFRKRPGPPSAATTGPPYRHAVTKLRMMWSTLM